MTAPVIETTAEGAAESAISAVEKCIDEEKSFILEAGAGAGKTYSLVHALRYLVETRGTSLLRRRQRIACITYTNAATDEIKARTDGHPAVMASTIHSFCWSLLVRFQSDLREELPNLSKWPDRLEESGGIGSREVKYDLGYPSAKAADAVYLSHDDVLSLMVLLLERPKFRALMLDQYPIIFIDEYQDTNRAVADALATHFLSGQTGLLLGLFGDHWQKIYRDGWGEIVDDGIVRIDKHANFRSAPAVVEMLNRMRPELPQISAHPGEVGSVIALHANSFTGQRQTQQHWKGDLPTEVAHEYLEALMGELTASGWDFDSLETKVLMLTHNVLAREQGYSELVGVFRYNEMFTKKEDAYIEFFADVLEPASQAYADRRFGDMVSVIGGRRPVIRRHSDKAAWAADMDALSELQDSGTVGAVVDHLLKSRRPRLPSAIEAREQEFKDLVGNPDTERPAWFEQVEKLHAVAYSEVRALVKFINGHTPFATKHGVKGLEFQNVLVVVGKGWNQYNFDQMLGWVADGGPPPDKVQTFERSRNLFYVTCSRSITNLAVLFTEKLSPSAIATLVDWFGEANVQEFQP